MAQDEKMLVPVEPTDTMIEAAVDAFPRSHPSVFPIIYRAMLSAAPAQPAAVEGAGEPVARIRGFDNVLVVDWTNDAMPPAGTALYAHPSPPADDALRVAVEALEKWKEFNAYREADPLALRFEFGTEEDRLAAANALDEVFAALNPEGK